MTHVRARCGTTGQSEAPRLSSPGQHFASLSEDQISQQQDLSCWTVRPVAIPGGRLKLRKSSESPRPGHLHSNQALAVAGAWWWSRHASASWRRSPSLRASSPPHSSTRRSYPDLPKFPTGASQSQCLPDWDRPSREPPTCLQASWPKCLPTLGSDSPWLWAMQEQWKLALPFTVRKQRWCESVLPNDARSGGWWWCVGGWWWCGCGWVGRWWCGRGWVRGFGDGKIDSFQPTTNQPTKPTKPNQPNQPNQTNQPTNQPNQPNQPTLQRARWKEGWSSLLLKLQLTQSGHSPQQRGSRGHHTFLLPKGASESLRRNFALAAHTKASRKRATSPAPAHSIWVQWTWPSISGQIPRLQSAVGSLTAPQIPSSGARSAPPAGCASYISLRTSWSTSFLNLT